MITDSKSHTHLYAGVCSWCTQSIQVIENQLC